VRQALRATDTEVMTLIETRGLFGLGIGHVDAHLLAATALTGGGTHLLDPRQTAQIRS
jgi:hypothetical protein